MNPFRYSNPIKSIPVQTWLKNDDKKQWQHNRKQLGEGWYYYNADDIEYKHNSYGYLCPEFDSSQNGKIKFRLWGVVYVYGKGNYQRIQYLHCIQTVWNSNN